MQYNVLTFTGAIHKTADWHKFQFMNINVSKQTEADPEEPGAGLFLNIIHIKPMTDVASEWPYFIVIG